MDMVIVGAPKYLRYAGVMARLGEESKIFGHRALVIGGRQALAATWEKIRESLAAAGIQAEYIIHTGECSHQAVEKYRARAQQMEASFLIGVGGGKAIDAAKGAAHFQKLPLVTIPTIAATCAAWTALCVLYTTCGKPDGQICTWRAPELILADLDILASVPARYLAAGMGDALAKLHETSVNAKEITSTVCTEATILISRLIYDSIAKYGKIAFEDNKNRRITHALKEIIDVNLLLTGIASGLAGDEIRLAAAHGLHNAMLNLQDGEQTLHGEKVAFGTVVQMILEGRSDSELEEVVRLIHSLELPVTLDDLHFGTADEETIRLLAESTVSDWLMKNSPYKVDAQIMADAIAKAQRMGMAVKKRLR